MARKSCHEARSPIPEENSMRRNGSLLGLLAVVAGLLVVNPAQAATPSVSPTVSTSPSGEAVPIGDIGVWRQTFVDDFTVKADTGTWATDRSRTVVYTGRLIHK